MSNVQYPIKVVTFYPTYSITNAFSDYEDFDKWLTEKKLNLVKSFQIGEFICCICAVPELKAEDLFDVDVNVNVEGDEQ